MTGVQTCALPICVVGHVARVGEIGDVAVVAGADADEVVAESSDLDGGAAGAKLDSVGKRRRSIQETLATVDAGARSGSWRWILRGHQGKAGEGEGEKDGGGGEEEVHRHNALCLWGWQCKGLADGVR